MAGETIEMAAASGGAGRERSTIEFPYGDLDDALEVAQSIYNNAGTSCETDQLAGFMGQSVKGGAFRVKLQVARMAGFVEVERGRISLTPLGSRVVDEPQRPQGLVEAFLNVQLYQQLFEKFRGNKLPPAAGLEREMREMGVASKQTAKARQAFERSAERAGFFQHGKDKLVQPVFRNAQTPPAGRVDREEKPPGSEGVSSPGGSGADLGGLDPLIVALVHRLPEAGAEWSVSERKHWLLTAENIFGLIYTTPQNDESAA